MRFFDAVLTRFSDGQCLNGVSVNIYIMLESFHTNNMTVSVGIVFTTAFIPDDC